MSVIIQGTQLREISLGRYVQGKTSTVSGAGTHQVFTVAGGEVLITSLWGKVDTAITGATGTYALQVDPTTGDTDTVVTATPLGATDVVAGTVLGVRDQGDGTTDFAPGQFALGNLVATTGEVELVAADATADGVIDWFCTWVPLTAGATVEASA